MLATSASELPKGDWAFEFKWDGVRALAFSDGEDIKLQARSLTDLTGGFPEITSKGRAPEAVFDGELLATDDAGKPSFQRIQKRLGVTGAPAAALSLSQPVAYVVFDVLELAGTDITALPWRERRQILETLKPSLPERWMVSSVEDDGEMLFALCIDQRLEGVMAKARSSPYCLGQRSTSWRKIKSRRRQEFVIGGYTESEKVRDLGALLVGYYSDAGLRFAGKVGTGFDQATLKSLRALLDSTHRDVSPFVDATPRNSRFCDPTIVAEIAFAEWSDDGRLRQPSFLGLRTDIAPTDVRREP